MRVKKPVRLYAAMLALGCLVGARAQEVDSIEVLRPVTAAYTAGFGSSHLADTYLSPIKYDGWATSLRYERLQAMRFNPERWVMQLSASVDLERAMNPVRNATMWYAGLNLSWAMMRRWRVAPGLSLAAGGEIAGEAGCLYLARNGNNPASAKAALTVGATGMAAYSMRLGRLPVTFAWQPSLPLAGAFFSPDYGELYYEIYLGNHSGLVHFAWPGSYFKLNNAITADFHFGATSLRLGYRGEIASTKVNHIVSHHYTHCFIVGVSGEWFSLNPRRPLSRRAKVVSALFNNAHR